MMLNFVCYLDGIKRSGSIVRAAHPSRLLVVNIYRKFANIWRIKRDGISTIKFEAAQTHFLSDVLVAVAFVVA